MTKLSEQGFSGFMDLQDYPHDSINVNGRNVQLTKIISGSITPLSDFESETFSFIKDWLKERGSFKLQTSGSTGTPKEITLTREQLQKSAERTIQALNLNSNDTAFVCLDTKYIAGKMMMVRALEGDMKIVAVGPSSNPLQNLSQEISISLAAFVPLQLQEILKDPDSRKKLNQMKAVIVGGAAVNSSLETEIKKLSCPVYATYGMTETVSHIALQQLNGKEASDHFTVLPGIEIEVDQRQRLVIRLPEFAEKIITNDLVELVSSTSFKWLGRFDNVINSGGFKISPEKVEKAVEIIFQAKKITSSFFVCGIPDHHLGQKLILVIEGFPTSGEKKILSALEQLVHPYEIPKKIYHIREFIRTDTGKIIRSQTAALIG